jgi:hypothetical protein
VKVYYYGCPPDDIGHYFQSPGAARVLHSAMGPWAYAVDGGLQPRQGEDRRRLQRDGALPRDTRPEVPQGVCAMHQKDGWTAIAWWDRSADKRAASCSALVFDEIISFERGVEIGREQFPWVFARMSFELILETAGRG